jgi:aerobic carbon-monoxide dehydrogenase large subunit
VAFGRGTFAVRSSLVGGVALRRAADAIIERAKGMAVALLEAAASDIEFKQGKFTVVGTDKAIAITDVARAFYASAGPVLNFGIGLEASGSYSGVPGAPPTIVNAVLDALAPLGVAHIDMPATPARVWTAINAAKQGSN